VFVDISQQQGERLMLVVREVNRLLACNGLLCDTAVIRLLEMWIGRMRKITHLWFGGDKKRIDSGMGNQYSKCYFYGVLRFYSATLVHKHTS
jgi:hypothetical protein